MPTTTTGGTSTGSGGGGTVATPIGTSPPPPKARDDAPDTAAARGRIAPTLTPEAAAHHPLVIALERQRLAACSALTDVDANVTVNMAFDGLRALVLREISLGRVVAPAARSGRAAASECEILCEVTEIARWHLRDYLPECEERAAALSSLVLAEEHARAALAAHGPSSDLLEAVRIRGLPID